MKKLLIVFGLFLLFQATAREEVPLLIDTGAVNIGFEEDNNSLINVDNMKKSQSVKKAKDETSQKSPKIKLDSREINHQRALNWTTKQTNTMMPLF